MMMKAVPSAQCRKDLKARIYLRRRASRVPITPSIYFTARAKERKEKNTLTQKRGESRKK